MVAVLSPNLYIMGFSGAEAFRGTSAPSLKAEVSGKGDNGLFVVRLFTVSDLLYFV